MTVSQNYSFTTLIGRNFFRSIRKIRLQNRDSIQTLSLEGGGKKIRLYVEGGANPVWKNALEIVTSYFLGNETFFVCLRNFFLESSFNSEFLGTPVFFPYTILTWALIKTHPPPPPPRPRSGVCLLNKHPGCVWSWSITAVLLPLARHHHSRTFE